MICSADETVLDLRVAPDAKRPSQLKDWSMVISLRSYRKGDGFLPYMGSHVLGHNGVIHCDILMKRPCTEVWCKNCDRGPEDDPCINCRPCKYRDIAYIPGQSKMSPEELRATRNSMHTDDRKCHVVTYTAREDGVVCTVDAIYKFNKFYHLQVRDEHANDVEKFFISQLRQPYNCTGYCFNFVFGARFCCPYGTYWIDLDQDEDDEDAAVHVSERPWFCSEIVCTALSIAHAKGFTPKDRPTAEPCGITPDQIAGIVFKYPDFYSEISQDDVMLSDQSADNLFITEEDEDDDEGDMARL